MSQAYPETASKFEYFEDVMEEVGWGLYSRYMMVVGCLLCFAHAGQSLSLPLGLPFSTCESNITEKVIINIYMYYFIGTFLGGQIMNSASDYFGRKKLIMFSLVSSFLCQFTCAFTNNLALIYCATFILGSCLENIICSVKVIVAEVLTVEKRPFYMVLFDICWTFGYTVTTGLSTFLVTSHNKEKHGIDMKLGYWRLIFAFTGGLTLFLACVASLMEESPRYLLHNKRQFLAVALVKQYFTINKSRYSDYLPIKENDLQNLIGDYNLTFFPGPMFFGEQLSKFLSRMCKAWLLLTKKRFMSQTLILAILNVSLFYGLFNTQSLLTNMLHNNGSETFQGVLDLHLIRPHDEQCTFNVEYAIYKYFLILCVSTLLGRIVLLFLVTRINTKIPMSIFCVLSSVCLFLTQIPQISDILLLLCCVTIASYGMVETLLIIKTIELFPTAVRCTVVGVTRFAKIAVFIIMVQNWNFPWMYIIFLNAILLLGGAIFSCFVDDLTGKPMVE